MGLSAKSFSDPQEFLASITSADTGFLVLDFQMPVLDGFQVLEQIEAKKCHLQTVIITADADARAEIRARFMGAVDVLEKPFNPRALIAWIEKAIATRPSD
jgi:two-component system, LuxR family, response regulator FixJ